MARRPTPRRESPEPSPETIRVVLVEPMALVGAGIREVIDGEPDMEVVAEVRTAADAVAAVEERAPHITLMDVELQEPAASAATRRLTQDSGSAVVIVGGDDDDASIMGAMEVGATGHVAAVAQPSELVAVIRRVADGEDPLRDEVVARPDLVDKVVEAFREGFRRQDSREDIPLTPRELEVLRQVAAGMKNRQIAEQLVLTEQTVKNHLSTIMHKLGVPNRTHAVTFAVRQGWLTLDEVAAEATSRSPGAPALIGAAATGDH
ncbi:MAG: LuxR C-terminal-related transcriptional regulator [Candidatus Limnocylindrales bacterium]